MTGIVWLLSVLGLSILTGLATIGYLVGTGVED